MRMTDFLRQVSDRLSDQEPGYLYETWTRPQMVDALNSALRIVANYRPLIWSDPVDVRLGPGDIFETSCERIVEILGVYDAAGIFVEPLDEVSSINQPLARRNARMRAKCGMRELLYPYAATIMSDSKLRVYPPITTKSDYTIRVLCSHVPQATSVDSDVHIPMHVQEIVQEFMLYYLYDIDAESVQNRERSNQHWSNAFTLLGVGNDRSSNR